MHARRLSAAALCSALLATFAAPNTDALTIARVTRHGYVLVDEPDSPAPYNGNAGAAAAADFANFVSDATQTLDAAGAPHGDYIAVMQGTFERSALAFYLPVRNTTRGIGLPLFDTNGTFGAAWPIEGALFLNTPMMYTGSFSDYGNTVICPQEFGHHFLTEVHVPPYSSLPQVEDAGFDDAGNPLDPPDAGALPADSLLGRDNVHWSYFLNSGGSPVEGNAWEEVSTGVFQNMDTQIQFSPLDLYLMGLIPSSMVPPFWLIAHPNVANLTDQNGNPLTKASPPEIFGPSSRTVTIHGQRATYGIDDIMRVHGPRVPAYSESIDAGADAEVPDAGFGVNVREMRVEWVLLTTSAMIDSRTVTQFDRAIEACSMGYLSSAHGLAHLTAVVMNPPDAGADASADTLVDAPVASDATPTDAPVADGFVAPAVRAQGGCGCRVFPSPTRLPMDGGFAVIVVAAAALRRSRRARALRT